MGRLAMGDSPSGAPRQRRASGCDFLGESRCDPMRSQGPRCSMKPRLAAVDVADHEALRCHPDHRRARRAIAIEERTFVKSVFKAGTAGVAHVQSRERAPRHARKEAARTFGETVPTGASYRCG